ncbi:MAG: nitroreductase family protein [Bacteroidota bacterium]
MVRRDSLVLTPDPWQIKEENFPRLGTPEDQLRYCLNYAVLAPSSRNTQPWLFRMREGCVELFADRTRRMPQLDPDGRWMVMSCGAALFHLRTALRHYGFAPRVRTFPDLEEVNLLSRVSPGASYEPTTQDHRLFQAITKRGTHRASFDDRPVPDAELDQLRAAVLAEGAVAHMVTNPEERHGLTQLIEEGQRWQAEQHALQQELAVWAEEMRPQRDPPATRWGAWKERRQDEEPVRRVRRRDIEQAPVLVVLTSDRDNAVEWLQMGQAVDHLLLQAADYGLHASFLNAPLEVQALRTQVAHMLGTSRYPHIILRLGYAHHADHTARRPVSARMLPDTDSPSGFDPHA